MATGQYVRLFLKRWDLFEVVAVGAYREPDPFQIESYLQHCPKYDVSFAASGTLSVLRVITDARQISDS